MLAQERLPTVPDFKVLRRGVPFVVRDAAFQSLDLGLEFFLRDHDHLRFFGFQNSHCVTGHQP